MKYKPITITVCTVNQYRDIKGLHLYCPDLFEIENGIKSAEDNGTTIVFAHYTNQGHFYDNVPVDVKNLLLKLAAKGHTVSFAFTYSI